MSLPLAHGDVAIQRLGRRLTRRMSRARIKWAVSVGVSGVWASWRSARVVAWPRLNSSGCPADVVTGTRAEYVRRRDLDADHQHGALFVSRVLRRDCLHDRKDSGGSLRSGWVLDGVDRRSSSEWTWWVGSCTLTGHWSRRSGLSRPWQEPGSRQTSPQLNVTLGLQSQGARC